MHVYPDTRYGRKCWRVEGASLIGRPYATDHWYIFRGANSVVAEVPTVDGANWEDIVIDERNEPQMEEYWSKLDKNPLKLAAAVRRDINGREEEPDTA